MTLTASPPTNLPLGAHQERALDAIMENEALLVEYGTGTGKTRIIVESTAAIIAAGETPVLILVPNSLIEQTVEEFVQWNGDAWTDRYVAVLDGNVSIYLRREALKRKPLPVTILSHEAMSYPLIREGINSRAWAAVLIDEGSRFRNYSKRTVTLRTLTSRAKTRYVFSGNLAPRSPADVWYVMNFLKPGLFGTRDRQTFLTDYCVMGGFEGRQPLRIKPDRLKQFQAIMDSMRITCELKDIRDLPPRTLSTRRVNMSGKAREAYKQMQDELRVEIERENDDTFRAHVRTYATRLQRLQEICAGFARNLQGEIVYLPSAKTTELVELLEDYPDKPTVIWYWWRPELMVIEAQLAKHRIPFITFTKAGDGSRERFMNGEANVYISQLGKGAYGLNLTRAERMIYHSLPWDLDVYMQSQERNMRLNTVADRLEVMHLVTRDSVDEYVRSKLLQKADVSSQLSRSQALALLRRTR